MNNQRKEREKQAPKTDLPTYFFPVTVGLKKMPPGRAGKR